MKYVYFVIAALISVSASQAAVTLPNADFEAGTVNFTGFDTGPNVPGWSDLAPMPDGGVDAPGTWWGTYEASYSAFIFEGTGTYNMSGHTIELGDLFTIEVMAKHWWNGGGQLTATLFYDVPANVIGIYSSDVTGDWVAYSNTTPIAATLDSVGGTLGIAITSTGRAGAGSEGSTLAFDNVSVTVVPEPSGALLAGLAALGLLRRRRAA